MASLRVIKIVKFDIVDDPTFAIVLEMKDTVPSEPIGKVRMGDLSYETPLDPLNYSYRAMIPHPGYPQWNNILQVEPLNSQRYMLCAQLRLELSM